MRPRQPEIGTKRPTDVPYRPTPLETASGLISGFGPPESLPAPEEAGQPVEALERAILPGLLRPPCLVDFSGDPVSAAILAVAVHLARRESLELPVPATKRFSGQPTLATARQERVIVQLGLTQWARFDYDEDHDLVGPAAMSLLRRYGLTSPADLHLEMPLIVEASGGSFITGAACSRPLIVPALKWLRPDARHQALVGRKHQLASQPLLWKDRFAWLRRLRSVQVGMQSLTELAAPLRVQVVNPLLCPVFSLTLQRQPSTVTPTELLGGLLSPDLLAGRAEHGVDRALWSRHSRELVDGWDGEGIDDELVDEDALRTEWSRERPSRHSFLLLQSVALANEGRSVFRQLAEAVGNLV